MNTIKKISAALVVIVLIFSVASPALALVTMSQSEWDMCMSQGNNDTTTCGDDPSANSVIPASTAASTAQSDWDYCMSQGGSVDTCGEDPSAPVAATAATPAATPAAATPAAATPAAASASNPIPTSTTNDGPIGPVNQPTQKFKADNYTGLVKCSGVKSASTDVECNFTYAISSIATLINWAFYVSIPVAVALFSWAGILYMSGVESKIKQAKTIFQNVAIGFIIALVAFTVVHTLVGWLVNPNIGAESLLKK
ncbi:MAG: pilin [bacterium]